MTRQVDAAAEGKFVVYNDQLLMVRPADRMPIVEPELHMRMCTPAESPS